LIRRLNHKKKVDGERREIGPIFEASLDRVEFLEVLIRKGPKNPVWGTKGSATREGAELETSQRGWTR
jgi:hypothetical protein